MNERFKIRRTTQLAGKYSCGFLRKNKMPESMSLGGGDCHPPPKDQFTNSLRTLPHTFASHTKRSAAPQRQTPTCRQTPRDRGPRGLAWRDAPARPQPVTPGRSLAEADCPWPGQDRPVPPSTYAVAPLSRGSASPHVGHAAGVLLQRWQHLGHSELSPAVPELRFIY